MEIRTRFAPSPTGFLHIGGLRTALYAYLFAKKHNGAVLLRVEDTDQSRLVEGAMQQQINALEWAGITFDEGPHIGGENGPYIQSERLDIYKEYVQKLIDNKTAYYCFCTKERLDKVREEQQAHKQIPKYDRFCCGLSDEEIKSKLENNETHVIRLLIPDNEVIEFNDIVRGKIKVHTKDIDDQVLMKSDGFPTYHLANIVDDHLMKITHVIRGEEWLPSTPKHVLLYRAFGWDAPEFAHLPLLLNADRSKLSKRQNDVSVDDYKNKGFLPDALNNFIALLGWNPGTDQEIFSMESLIEHFDLSKTHKAGAVFNLEKLEWINGMYLRELSRDEFFEMAKPFLKAENVDLSDIEYVKDVISLEQNRIKRLDELPELITHFFEDQLSYDKELLKWKKADLTEANERLGYMKNYLNEYSKNWDIETLESTIKPHIKEQDLGMGNTLWPLRIALCGKQNSPSPFELMSVLGKEKTLQRIDFAINLLSS